MLKQLNSSIKYIIVCRHDLSRVYLLQYGEKSKEELTRVIGLYENRLQELERKVSM